MADLTEEQLKALQKKGLEMAVYFRDFCAENKLLAYFCGGCCIGAVRHQGFIASSPFGMKKQTASAMCW